ncbi:MAG: hypothetical protein OXC80_00585 [Gammaproteobacteria bacterium]|nr:hypothetical protein [Gammaproteobacteria bacterium]
MKHNTHVRRLVRISTVVFVNEPLRSKTTETLILTMTMRQARYAGGYAITAIQE